MYTCTYNLHTHFGEHTNKKERRKLRRCSGYPKWWLIFNEISIEATIRWWKYPLTYVGTHTSGFFLYPAFLNSPKWCFMQCSAPWQSKKCSHYCRTRRLQFFYRYFLQLAFQSVMRLWQPQNYRIDETKTARLAVAVSGPLTLFTFSAT